jgi:parallel beta-helix repeat protein
MPFALVLAAVQERTELPAVRVDRDDIVIETSCVLDIAADVIEDADGDGVVRVTGSNLIVQFPRTPLRGAKPGVEPDAYAGIGVMVTGTNVYVRGAIVSGFKGGIVARGADGLVVEGCDVSDNFRQRLKSTPQAEDGADWLFPHENDGDEWLANYGAGIYVAESKGVTIRNNFARRGQNGLCLRRVDDSRVYDNDMSFLSGWGLAMYRSSHNVVDHNSFDFCVRGYSHGVYWRGQDSAGILAFELCSDNVFAYNSATHGGDGFFGFAGLDALDGVVKEPGAGCNRNDLIGNDFSDSPANAIEMTFSFGNHYGSNDLSRANQHGIWGGYSHESFAIDNVIEDCVEGGISIEHGTKWYVAGNRFARNGRAIELWWDEDPDLLAKPWAKLNPTRSGAHVIARNRFEGDTVQLELRGGTRDVEWDGDQEGTDRSRWRVGEKDYVRVTPRHDAPPLHADLGDLPGKRRAVGARPHLKGRDKIMVTPWGPYDWEAPYLQRVADRDGAHGWRLLGNEVPVSVDAGKDAAIEVDTSTQPSTIVVRARKKGTVTPYELVVRTPSTTLTGSGALVDATWTVTVFAWKTDPREDADAWRREQRSGARAELPRLKLVYAHGGPSELAGAPQAFVDAKLPGDRFGTIAATGLKLPAGRWRLRTLSDDGIRVWMDGKTVIDDWTHHGPRPITAEFESDGDPVSLAVEHFELDGYAVLEVDLEPVQG